MQNADENVFSLCDSEGNTVEIRSVLDSYGCSHDIAKVLGQGGQGVVCLTRNPEIVIKFALDSKGRLICRDKNKETFLKNDAAFKAIMQKPFPERLHLAYPMARLVDYSGYVMRLMGDMTGFSDLVPLDVTAIRKMAEDGGHRRRFELLAKLAALLAKMHGVGMVYCDLSPNNVFVTKDPKFTTQNVWLIDADNVFIPGEDSEKLVYTPRYAAPELLEGKSCSINSDVYSFATLAFETLAALHPFAGKMAKVGGFEDDWDVTAKDAKKEDEQKQVDIDPQYSGKIPWVEDFSDVSNHTDDGLPRQNFLTDETFTLFNMTFSEEGRENPKIRPTSVLWARAFAHSQAQSVRCPDCGMSFVYDESSKKCPWCDKKHPPILLLKDENGKVVFAHELEFCEDNSGPEFSLPEHVFMPFDVNTFYRGVFKVRTVNYNGRGIEFSLQLQFVDNCDFFMGVNGKEEKISGRYILQIRKGETYALKCVGRNEWSRTLSVEIVGKC